MPKASIMGGAKRCRSLAQFCSELCCHVPQSLGGFHPLSGGQQELNIPAFWFKSISYKALSIDPTAIAQCVQPSCTDNIGLKPDAVKGEDRVCLQRVTVTSVGSTSIHSSTTRSSEGSKVIRNIVYQTLTQISTC